MAINVFVSFNHTDQKQLEAFNSLKNKTKHVLEFHDHSCKEISPEGSERLVACQINEVRSKPIKEEIIKKFEQCSKLLVLIGVETYKDAWAEWEINNFYKMKNTLSPGNAWKMIRGMFLEGCEQGVAPKALECRSTKRLVWDPETLEKWLGEDSGL